MRPTPAFLVALLCGPLHAAPDTAASPAKAPEPVPALRASGAPAATGLNLDARSPSIALSPLGLPGAEAPAAAEPRLQPLLLAAPGASPRAAAAQPGSLSAIMSGGAHTEPATGKLSEIIQRSAQEARAAFGENKDPATLEAARAEMKRLAESLEKATVDADAAELGHRLQTLITELPQAATPEVEAALHRRIDRFVSVLEDRSRRELAEEHYVRAGDRYLPRPDVRAAFSVYRRLAELRSDLISPRLDGAWFRFQAGVFHANYWDWAGKELAVWAVEQLGRIFALAPGPGPSLAAVKEARLSASRQRFSPREMIKESLFPAGVAAVVGLLGGEILVLNMLHGALFSAAGLAAWASVIAAAVAVTVLPLAAGPWSRLRRLKPRLRAASLNAQAALLARFVETARQQGLARTLGEIAAFDDQLERWMAVEGHEAEFEQLRENWPEFRRVVDGG